MIDEYPILFVAAALANGPHDDARASRSCASRNRIASRRWPRGCARSARASRSVEDGLIVDGTGGDPLAGGATIAARLDHRIAMSFAIAGLVSRQAGDDRRHGPGRHQLPDFAALLDRRSGARSGMIIAVDGPAASGKGTIARAIARHYGLPHLDTGLLYRAVGLHVLREGGDPADAGRCARRLRVQRCDARRSAAAQRGGRRRRLDRLGASGGARGADRAPARLRRAARRRGARRARHRHGDRAACRRQAVRQGRARRPRPPPPRRDRSRAASTSATTASSPTSASATGATRCAITRRWCRRPTPTCSIPPTWI